MGRNPSREEALFTDALALPPAERGLFLAQACGADVELLSRVSALLAAHDGPGSLMLPTVAANAVVPPREKPGDWLGRYRLLQQIGEGGCGVVWMAEQEEPVRRRVALKVVKLGMDTASVIARFEAERQALAMMEHPNIAKVHDAGSTDTGRPYFVMELVRGIPITKYCDEHQLKPVARLELFIKVCRAVQHAHQKGIIHRDLKPSNILVTMNDGQATPKVIDFGIAKATQGRLTDATLFTAFEQFIGTPVYMSPEQAEMSSVDIDTRSDIYSLGVLLYELLTGRPPFDPKSFASAGVDQIRQQIREKEPPRPSLRWQTLGEAEKTTVARLRDTLPAQLSLLLRGDLDWIVMRCLEKDRTRRYETANGLALDIERHLRHEPVVARPPSTAYLLQKLFRRHRFGFAAAGIVLGVIIVGAITTATQATRALRAEREQNALRETAQQEQVKAATARLAAEAEQQRSAKQSWVRQHVMPEIKRLVATYDIAGAFAQATEAKKYVADDPALAELWERISTTTSIETTPSGAEIYVKPYLKPTAEWQRLGKSPLKNVRLARDAYRWQVRKEAHALVERATGVPPATITFTLPDAGFVPPGMVLISGRPATAPASARKQVNSRSGFQVTTPLDEFFIDRYEVTNREFKAFIDRGGYVTAGWWKQPFIEDGREISRAEAIARFRDATGRPGPSTWRDGTYPPGDDEYPVAGVSWFEAAAYAESVGKRLPSFVHWKKAAGGTPDLIVSLSNFNGRGPVAVGRHHGMSIHGVQDMAGNVKEWCWNEAEGGKRYILGGSADEPAYQFSMTDAQSPFDRSRSNGFRCIKLVDGPVLPESVDGPVVWNTRDYSKDDPVGDEAFRLFRSLFTYDKMPLEAQSEPGESQDELWRSEIVTFTAAYGGERMSAVLLLPKNATPPFQAVIHCPSMGAFRRDSARGEGAARLKSIVENGRALVLPTFKGTLERGDGRAPDFAGAPTQFRDLIVCWSRDLGRTIDYLETRTDIRSDKLAFLGSSFGAAAGAVLPALESRLKANVLVSGGMWSFDALPEIAPVNFAPRITTPTLMINGRYDFTFPVPAQVQLFRLLGTPPEHKRHVLLDLPHNARFDLYINDIIAWLDRYLGPVK